MLNVQKWGEGKPKIVAMIAQQMVSSAPAVIEQFQDWKSNPTRVGIQPDLRTWLNFYKNHRKIKSFLKNFFFKDSARFSSTVTAYGEVFFEAQKVLQRSDRQEINKIWKSLSKTEKEALLVKMQRRIDRLYQKSLKDLSSDITGDEDSRLTKSMRKGVELPEFAFFMRVWTQCWLLHGKAPATLLRKARSKSLKPKEQNESLKAFEKLLRIDNSIIFDPRLAEKFHQLKAKKNKKEYRQLLHAFGKPPKEKIAPQKIKYTVAGFISYTSQILKSRLSEPQIWALFDAYAKDAGLEVDPDLAEIRPETFSKAIQREVKNWKTLLQPDKK